jgi:hypothetical protein
MSASAADQRHARGGLTIARVECEPLTGKVSIIPGAPKSATDQNPWDAVLTK